MSWGEPPPDYGSIINPHSGTDRGFPHALYSSKLIYKKRFGHAYHTLQSFSLHNNLGFLQKNNNLDEKSRIVASLNEPSSPQKLSLQDSHFRRSETDFSNLYARGERVRLLSPSILNE